ncbi:MAG: hypothetical protein AAF411_02690 [Myxococcota bacterium]
MTVETSTSSVDERAVWPLILGVLTTLAIFAATVILRGPWWGMLIALGAGVAVNRLARARRPLRVIVTSEGVKIGSRFMSHAEALRHDFVDRRVTRAIGYLAKMPEDVRKAAIVDVHLRWFSALEDAEAWTQKELPHELGPREAAVWECVVSDDDCWTRGFVVFEEANGYANCERLRPFQHWEDKRVTGNAQYGQDREYWKGERIPQRSGDLRIVVPFTCERSGGRPTALRRLEQSYVRKRPEREP